MTLNTGAPGTPLVQALLANFRLGYKVSPGTNDVMTILTVTLLITLINATLHMCFLFTAISTVMSYKVSYK
jgi:hypothetical protein